MDGCCEQGSEVAAELVAGLDVFQQASNVRADPDKPLQHVRIQTLKVRIAFLLIASFSSSLFCYSLSSSSFCSSSLISNSYCPFPVSSVIYNFSITRLFNICNLFFPLLCLSIILSSTLSVSQQNVMADSILGHMMWSQTPSNAMQEHNWRTFFYEINNNNCTIVYGAVIMALYTARVHPVHLTNVAEWRCS